MKSKDLKSLCETIANTVEAIQPKQLAEGYMNSLTEKARQLNEEKEKDEKEESPAEEKAEDKAEMLMKKLAAKALKRAKKKAATNEEVELAEKAAPGYEDWASDPKVKASFKKQYGKDWKQVMYGRSWNMKKMDEETEQLDEISDTLLFRARAKAKGVGKFKVRTNPSFAGSSKDVPLHKKITQELQRRGSVPVSESEQLDEAGYKRLGRIKGAAYKAELASRGADPNTSLQGLVKAAKLKRAAAEREAQVAAGMARRGGASPDAVRGGGGRLGPSGKYTQKAGKLANQRDKALAKFRMKARTAQLFDKGEDQSRKRERQQAQAAFEKKARTGDFGQDNQAALRARSNFQKRFGRLKGK